MRGTATALACLLGCVLLSFFVTPQGGYVDAYQAPTQNAYFGAYMYVKVFNMNIYYSGYVNGCTMRIIGGYHYGYDRLVLQYYGGASLTQSWDWSTGKLVIRGRASGYEYGNIVSSVYFYTTSYGNWWQIGRASCRERV